MKMHTHTTIHIPEPCSQSWAKMTPEAGGRHCTACAQTVTDFTRMSDAQILEVLRNAAGGCGRFRAGQLSRELIAPPAEKRFSPARFYRLVASLLLVFSAGKAAAQGAMKLHTTVPPKMGREVLQDTVSRTPLKAIKRRGSQQTAPQLKQH